jgi:hypothetical protein
VSDQIDRPRLAMIRSFINKHLDEIAEGSRVTVYLLASQEGPLQRLTPSLVKARRPEDANPLTDAALVLKRDNERFTAGVDKAFATIAAARGSQLSPILEGLFTLSHDPEFLALPKREIILASDLVAKSNCIDQFGKNYSFDTMLGREELSDLGTFQHARIWIKQLRVNTKFQTPQLTNFWRAYFNRAQLQIVEWTAL